jgi:hypothetical protein
VRNVVRKQGQLEKALSMFQQTLDISLEALGREHEEIRKTFAIMANRGSVAFETVTIVATFNCRAMSKLD